MQLFIIKYQIRKVSPEYKSYMFVVRASNHVIINNTSDKMVFDKTVVTIMYCLDLTNV